MCKTRVAIIGTGNISHFHTNAYLKNPDVEIVAVCDIDLPKAKAYAEKYAVPAVYADYNEMLAEVKPDAVSVTTWNSAHCQAAIAALKAGANVLCEKPMAINAAEAEQMEKASIETGKLLQIGFVRRFMNDATNAKAFIDSGKAGDIYYAKVSYLRRNGCPGGWFADKSYAGGGPLIDIGVHVMDLARYLAGCPKPVAAYGATYSNIGHNRNSGDKAWTAEDGRFKKDVEDFTSAFVRFDNGFMMQVEASFNLNIKEDDGTVEIFGNKAGIKLGAPDQAYLADGSNIVLDDPELRSSSDFSDIFTYEINHFIDCVRTGIPCRAPAHDGVMLMKMIDAIYESARTGHEVAIQY